MTIQHTPVEAPQTASEEIPQPATEAEIARRVRAHHATMAAELDRLTAALCYAVPDEQEHAQQKVAEWFETVLVPHADEEELTTYRAASGLPEGRLLIAAMMREHTLIRRLVALFAVSEPGVATAYGRAVYEAFDSHQAMENDLILPLLLDAPTVSLAAVMSERSEHEHAHC